MFSRFVRPYRRFRKYGRKRLGRRGISFASLGSKVLKSMDPPGFNNKKRKYASMSLLMSQDEEKEMGIAPAHSMGPMEAPLSKVRFKDPSSDAFEYHHFVRRIEANPSTMVCGGATGATGSFSISSTLGALIPDIAALQAIYGRVRVTRVQWEFRAVMNDAFSGPTVSTIPHPTVLFYCPKNATQAFGAPTTYAEAVDDPHACMVPNWRSFTVDSIPVVALKEDMDDGAGGFALTDYNSLTAPWVASNSAIALHSGIVWWKQSVGVAAYTSQIYNVFATTWFDMDNQE